MQKPNKLFTGIIASVLGLLGGVAATSYALGIEKSKITTKLEGQDKSISTLFDLINTNLIVTQGDIRSINDSLSQIKTDIAVLKAINEKAPN